VQEELLAKNDHPDLRGYVVWVPKLGGRRDHVGDATRVAPDARATHYWDETGVTIRAYTAVLDLPEDAWDIYMVYGPEARWEGALPPRPAFWMHQLGSRRRPRVEGPYLDAAELAAEAARRLGPQS
jgi:hypothetical protein